MLNKKLLIGVSLGVVVASALGYVFLSENEEEGTVAPPVVEQKKEIKPTAQEKKQVVKNTTSIKKANLYNSIDKNMPFSAIADLSVLSSAASKTVNHLLARSSGGIYFLKRDGDKVVAIIDLTPEDEENSIKRHDFNFVEISALDGSVLTNNNIEQDSNYDKWEFENDLPLSHAHYDENKELVYTEVWNYSEDEPVKYKKSDKDGQVISLRKEVVDNGVNLREEHIFYDEEGNMTKNVSFNYDGLDLTRFTYYNSKTPNDSAMIVSEFEDGVKKKETVYSSDYKIQNTYIPEYKDGQKSEIKILDKNNNLIETLQAE